MNLKDYLDKQAAFDEYIKHKHNITGDVTEENLLALSVEIAECCNEWRKFKYWSSDRTSDHYKMLEEYVDGLHFLFSIANHEKIELEDVDFVFLEQEADYEAIVYQFNLLFNLVSSYPIATYNNGYSFKKIVDEYFLLGSMLNFSQEELEEMYRIKTNVNFRRQQNGY